MPESDAGSVESGHTHWTAGSARLPSSQLRVPSLEPTLFTGPGGKVGGVVPGSGSRSN